MDRNSSFLCFLANLKISVGRTQCILIHHSWLKMKVPSRFWKVLWGLEGFVLHRGVARPIPGGGGGLPQAEMSEDLGEFRSPVKQAGSSQLGSQACRHHCPLSPPQTSSFQDLFDFFQCGVSQFSNIGATNSNNLQQDKQNTTTSQVQPLPAGLQQLPCFWKG